MNETLNGWINYSHRKDKKIFLCIQDLVIYNIYSGHFEECLEMLDRLNPEDEMVQLISFEYKDRLENGILE